MQSKTFSPDDIAGVDMDHLLQCSFCEIGGQKVDQKLRPQRTTTRVDCDNHRDHQGNDESDELKDPTWVAGMEPEFSEPSDFESEAGDSDEWG